MKLTKTTKCTFVYVVAFVVQADWLRAGAEHDPLIIARVLASRYPENAVMSYIPALSWSGAIPVDGSPDEGRWREKAQREMQTFISGEKPSVVEPTFNRAGLSVHRLVWGEPRYRAAARAETE